MSGGCGFVPGQAERKVVLDMRALTVECEDSRRGTPGQLVAGTEKVQVDISRPEDGRKVGKSEGRKV